MELVLDIAGDQIDGARDYQEDAFLTSYLDEEDNAKVSALVVLADGMGGHAAGNIASNLVCSTFNKLFGGQLGKVDIPDIMHESLASGNKALAETISETPALSGMGCTIAAIAVDKGKLWWLSVGDSHIYLLRDREITKVNEDHSYGGYIDRMVAQGVTVEAEPGLSRNMLMSAITGEDIPQIDCPTKPMQLLAGDRIIVASDGLDTLDAESIVQNSVWSSSVKECVSGLLRAVEDAKKARQDNTTIVVVDVMDKNASTQSQTERGAQVANLADRATRREKAKTHDKAARTTPSRETAKAPSRVALFAGFGALLAAGCAFGFYFLDAPASLEAILPEHKLVKPKQAQTLTETPPTSAAPVDAAQAEEPARAPAGPPQYELEEFSDRLSSGGRGPVMVKVPELQYTIGSGSYSLEREEQPQRTIRFLPFAISKHEVTIKEYQRFAAVAGRRLQKADGQTAKHPVVFVSAIDAAAYAAWLSKQTGHRYRLPSEAEWEYAASGTTNTSFWWGRSVGAKNAHCFDCDSGFGVRSTAPVGSFAANPFGLHDTAGNVMEWTADCYVPSYANAPSDASAVRVQPCAEQSVRGGAYGKTSTSMRSKKRDKRIANRRFDNVGIRLVRDL